jgi:hypothetical protein
MSGTVGDQQERRVVQTRADLFARARAELAERLRPVCQGMDQQAFDELVDRAAEIQIKYQLRRRVDFMGSATDA